MDFQRVFLFIIFSFSTYLLWDGWQREQHPLPQFVSAAFTPVASQSIKTANSPENPLPNAVSTQLATQAGEKIIVRTDFFRAEISSIGGDIRRIELLKHLDTEDKNKPFVLFQHEDGRTYMAQSGLLGSGMPTHNTLFSSQLKEYDLTEGHDSIQVRLSAKGENGIKVVKVFVFHKSSYLIDVGYEIENTGTTPLISSAYFQLVRDEVEPVGATKFVPTYTGPAIYTEHDKFQKIDFASISKNKAKIPQPSDNGWVGMLQHYFVSAW